MGHESQIELWSPNLTTFCFVGFGTDRLRRQEAMKTAGKENPNCCAITRQPTELLERKLKLPLLNQAGWKARKHPAAAKYFFLTFPFIDASSDGRRNTIWYKSVFKGGVYEGGETVWAFCGAEERRVASLEGRADVA